MPYLPKSKIKIQNTPGGELVYKLTKKPYIGSFIEVSSGKYYAGGDPTNLNTELVTAIENSSVQFGEHPDVMEYKRLNKAPFEALKTTIDVVGTKTRPSDKDYQNGFYQRFFVKRHNLENSYMEIDADTYLKLVNKNPIYDHRLYKAGSIEWSLMGDAEKTNSLQLKNLEKNFPLLYTLFPILNEFQDSTEVVVRTEAPSFRFVPGGTTQTSGTSSPSTPSYGGGSSGGGGGGY